VSEWGISLTYNTHLLEWDIDKPNSGIPVLNGYIFIQGSDEILNPGYNVSKGEEEIRLHPLWTTENSLRVCMSFYSEQNGGVSNREYIRWSLEYKPPKYFASFWPQMVSKQNGTLHYAKNIKSFCAASRNDTEEPEAQEVLDDGSRRMLLTDSEAIAEEKRLEQYEADMNADAAPLPPEFNGYVTTLQYVDNDNLTANISFSRLFQLESDYNMAIDITQQYKVFLNWGVFDNTTDTNTTYIFGSSKASDA
jgi:hypothetical protein